MLNPTAFYACINILHVLTRGRPRSPKTQGRSRICWRYVGTFFVLGRLFCVLGCLLRVCWTFFTHVRLFFRVSGRSGSDLGTSKSILEGPKLLFFGALSCGGVCNSKKLRMRKNHSFSCVFVWFLHIASFVVKSQNHAKSFLGPVQQSFLQRLCSHSVLKWILEGFGALWGVT